MFELALTAILLFILGVVTVRGTVFLAVYFREWWRDSRPKVFPRPAFCPRCERPIVKFGRLRSFQQLLFGGWSCVGCGSEFDQLDKVRVARAWNAHLIDHDRRSRSDEEISKRNDSRTPVERLIDD